MGKASIVNCVITMDGLAAQAAPIYAFSICVLTQTIHTACSIEHIPTDICNMRLINCIRAYTICIHIHMCIHVYIHTHIIYIHTYTYLYMYMCICVYVYIYIYIQMHIHIHIHINVCIYISLSLSLYIYIYMYVHIAAQLLNVVVGFERPDLEALRQNQKQKQ